MGRSLGAAAMVLLGTLAGACGEPADVPPAAPRSTVSAAPIKSTAPATKPRTIEAAVRAAAERVDVPVVLPRGLSKGTALLGTGAGAGRAYISLLLPGGRVLQIQYGRAGFDGCGPLNPKITEVGSAPAVIAITRHRGRSFTTLVWPATLDRLEGRYGLSGELGPGRMLAFAESMKRSERGAGHERAGC